MSGQRILVVDDEPQIVRGLSVLLRSAGYEPVPAHGVEEALDAASLAMPQAAIVDLLLPDGDGIELSRRLREWTDAPIILLSAVGDEEEKVRALKAGADDYVVKPFAPRELVARLEAVLRRLVARLEAVLRRASAGNAEAVLRAEGLELDVAGRTLRVRGEEVHLTPKEFDLLRVLMRHSGRLLTHTALLREVWNSDYADDVTILRSHIANLRRKIDPPDRPSHIRTDAGVGYRFAG
jgi:two-component system, OmpR family, KDP operon response regulator KdpE